MSKNETENYKPSAALPDLIDKAVDALRRGEVVVFPTETLYGLGANALDPRAVERVYVIKGRDRTNPIPVLVSDREMLGELVSHVPPVAALLIERFWPGPLTLILPAKSGLPAPLLNSAGGVGVRISSHPVAASLVAALRRPLTATSANPAGREPARTVADARAYFSGRVEIYLDGGKLPSRVGSTVVDALSEPIQLVREGEISANELRSFLEAAKQ